MFFHRKKAETRAVVEEQPPALHVPAKEEFAPLFVKVEKYHDVLMNLNEMKTFVSGMKQLFNVLSELETVRGDSLKIMRSSIQRFERSLVELDTELLRPKGLVLEQYGEVEVQHIEESLNDLQAQLATLRKELQEFK